MLYTRHTGVDVSKTSVKRDNSMASQTPSISLFLRCITGCIMDGPLNLPKTHFDTPLAYVPTKSYRELPEAAQSRSP